MTKPKNIECQARYEATKNTLGIPIGEHDHVNGTCIYCGDKNPTKITERTASGLLYINESPEWEMANKILVIGTIAAFIVGMILLAIGV